MTLLSVALASFLSVVLAPTSKAPPVQSERLNLDVSATYRTFGNSPEGSYGSGRLAMSGYENFELFIIGSGGTKGSTMANGQTIFFGGDDIELGFLAHNAGSPLTYGVGLDFPSVFNRSSAVVTYTAMYALTKGTSLGVRGYLGGSGVAAVMLTHDMDLSDRLSAHFGAGTLVAGNSTISTSSANAIRQVLAEADLRYKLNETSSMYVGLTNTLGDSTRFSLASSVGNRFGVVVGLKVRF